MVKKILILILILFLVGIPILINAGVTPSGEDGGGNGDGNGNGNGDGDGDGDGDGECNPCAGVEGICIPNPLRACTFEDLVESIINFFFYIALAIVPLMVIIGAFFIMTAAGDPKRLGTGKNIILYSAIGLAIILFAKGIISLIKHVLGTS